MPEPRHLVAGGLERRGVDPRLGVHEVVLEVQARRVDRPGRVELPGIAMPPLKKDPPRRTLYALLPAAGAHPLADPLLQALLQAATTAPPRLGSPPPANAPVTGSRSTA